MTNNEILSADLLDILFDKRNKDYGAYALRRGYQQRLLLAMGISMAIILFFILFGILSKKNEPPVQISRRGNEVIITTLELPKEKQPEKPREIAKPKPPVKIASVKHTSNIAIRPDILVKTPMTAIKDMEGKQISDVTVEGRPFVNIAKPPEPAVTGTATDPAMPVKELLIEERSPEFPGGPEALKRFLANNLVTPEDLEIGEKKMVQIKFKVDKDGTVSTLEIINSGGKLFDGEVIRVCRKMPRWRPAIQNGVNVPVSYVLPVTFIGVEQ